MISAFTSFQKKNEDLLPCPNPAEALDALEEDNEYLTRGSVFPKDLLKRWIRLKRAEADKINRIPHPAEFACY